MKPRTAFSLSLLLLLPVLAFLCVPDARAETPPAQAQDEILQNIDFQPVPMQEDLMAFDRIPTGIALSESGFAAASYDRNTRRFLLLFCPDGEVKQYTFCTSGSYALEMNGDTLSVYLVRSDLELRFGLADGGLSVRPRDTNEVTERYRTLKGADRLEAGGYRLRASTEHARYALYRNEELLLQTTASALLVHRLGYCWPFVVMAIGMLLFYRQTKQRSRQQSEATP